MAKVRCKGTQLQQTIGTVLTEVAQVISLNTDGMESETYESDTLDNSNSGIPYSATGRSEGGSISGEMFFDPALAGHQSMIELITTPPTTNEIWAIVFADGSSTTWSAINAAGFSFGVTVALNDGLKASFSIKIDGLPTFP